MIDITQSIKACAAFYGKDADAMELYLKEGEKKALDLDNRGPIKFDDKGKRSNCFNNRFLYFDIFENKKLNILKVGYRFKFQSIAKSLTDEEIDKVMNSLIKDALLVDGISIEGL